MDIRGEVDDVVVLLRAIGRSGGECARAVELLRGISGGVPTRGEVDGAARGEAAESVNKSRENDRRAADTSAEVVMGIRGGVGGRGVVGRTVPGGTDSVEPGGVNVLNGSVVGFGVRGAGTKIVSALDIGVAVPTTSGLSMDMAGDSLKNVLDSDEVPCKISDDSSAELLLETAEIPSIDPSEVKVRYRVELMSTSSSGSAGGAEVDARST